MTREEFLKNLIERKFDNVKSFAESIDLPYTTVRSILSRGVLNAKMENVIKICDGLDISPEDLANAAFLLDTAKRRSSATDKRRDAMNQITGILPVLETAKVIEVADFATEKLLDQNKDSNETIEFPNIINESEETEIVTGRGTAAGNPIDGDTEDTTATLSRVHVDDIPSGTNEIVTVEGDSMEPDYPKYSQIFVHWQSTVDDGDLAIVHVAEEGVTFKQIYLDYESKTIILHSLNPEYDDRKFDEGDVKVIGKVLN